MVDDDAGDVDCRAAFSLAAVAASSSGEKINGTSPASFTFCIFLGMGRGSADMSSLYLLDMAQRLLRLCICEPSGSSWEWRLPADGVAADLVIEAELGAGFDMGVQTDPCEETGIGVWGGDVEKYDADGSWRVVEKLISGIDTGDTMLGEKLAEVVGGLVG